MEKHLPCSETQEAARKPPTEPIGLHPINGETMPKN